MNMRIAKFVRSAAFGIFSAHRRGGAWESDGAPSLTLPRSTGRGNQHSFVTLVLLVAGFAGSTAPNAAYADGPPVRLAGDGRAALPVVISANASARTKAAAGTLAGYLGRISDA